MHARVLYVSETEDRLIEKMHVIPAHSIDEALQRARKLVGMDTISILAIPDGVSVIVEE